MRFSKFTVAVSYTAAVLAVGISLAAAKVVVSYPLSDTSGHVRDIGSDKPINASNDLGDIKDYAQAGPTAGNYGEITLSTDDAASIKSAHFGGKTKLNLGPAKDSALNLTGNFTVTAWAKFDSVDGYHMFLATGAGSGNGWKFGVNDGNLTFTANGVADVSVEDQTIETGKWVFLAVTVKGDKDARTITFYLNGKKLNAQDLTADDIKQSDVAQMHVGGADNSDDADENFVGNLAQLRVYDTVLDAAAIKAAAAPVKP